MSKNKKKRDLFDRMIERNDVSLFEDDAYFKSLCYSTPPAETGTALVKYSGGSSKLPLEKPYTPSHSFFEMEQVETQVWAGRGPLLETHVSCMVKNGVTHYLDLRERFEFEEYRDGSKALDAIKTAGIERKNISVRDMHAPTVPQMETILEYIQTVLADPNNVLYVTCRAGKERTATVLIAWLARRDGLDYETAYRTLKAKRSVFCPLPCQEFMCRQFLGETTGARREFAKQNVFYRLVSGMPLVGKYEAVRRRNGSEEVFTSGSVHSVLSAVKKEITDLSGDYDFGGRLQKRYKGGVQGTGDRV